MLKPVVQEGLTDKQVDQLQEFLDTLPRAMNFEHVDGFFCALICGPEQVPMDEFLPYIFGGQAPNFQSSEQAGEILNLLAEHWKYVADKLISGTPYYPFLYADQEDKCSANNWADAFLLGTQLRPEGWSELLEDQSEHALLREIRALRAELSELAQGKQYTIPSDERNEMIETIVANMTRIYDHFSNQPAEQSASPAQ
ncbi:MAG: UPF0149 family protein [Burkholderiaceae bacterium]|nr:UPF0149 family protein [Burkholderiaceae bacterium]